MDIKKVKPSSSLDLEQSMNIHDRKEKHECKKEEKPYSMNNTNDF